MSMKEDRAREGKKARYRKMGFGPMMDKGEIDFGDKHPLTKKRLKNFKKKDDAPMSDERFYQQRKAEINKAGLKASKMLSGGQAKLDKNKNNRLDAQDFKILKAEKAKNRGMGLQDEKVQPGKVMKAKRGKLFQGYLGTFDASAEASTPRSQRGVTTIVGVKPGSKIGKGKKKFKSMEEMRKAKGFKPGETSSQFNKRRMMLEGAKKAAKANKYGKVALGVAAAGMGAIQYLKSKMNKKDEPKKKMGGGMMKKYSKGGGLDMGGGRAKGLIPEAQEKAKSMTVKSSKRGVKKMGGGMMQRPMGYKHGSKPGAGLLGETGTQKERESGKRSGRDTQRGKKRENYFTFKFPKKEGPANKETTIKEIKLRSRGQLGKTMSRMGGGMMQKPMGYRSGTMIKARGCKLGRTRPTKIT